MHSFYRRVMLFVSFTCMLYDVPLCVFSMFQIPVMFNALGGILVGLVTTHAGGVRKASFFVFLA